MNNQNTAVLRAKIKVGSVIENRSQANSDMPEKKHNERIIGHAVYSDNPESENKQWAQWTPSFHLDMQVDNSSAFGKLEQGKEYYIDFIPVETTESQSTSEQTSNNE